jgi:hypothetical protein
MTNRNRAILRTGYVARMPNPRGCPGSHEKAHPDEHGRAVCSFCNNDYRVRKDGRLSAHARHM